MARSTIAARFEQSVTKAAFKSYLAEFISTFFFVFVVYGSSLSSRKLMPNATGDPSALTIVALANAFALSSAIYIAANISGGHVNPAVTYAMAIGGHISVPSAVFYWASQMLASVLACIILKVITISQHVPTYAIAQEMTGFGASTLEGILTFGLVYIVYAAGDPRRGLRGGVGTLMIGIFAGASVLALGPFSGGAMNPACALGFAVAAGTFKNQAVYWIGPLIGAGVAGICYDYLGSPDKEPPDQTTSTQVEGQARV